MGPLWPDLTIDEALIILSGANSSATSKESISSIRDDFEAIEESLFLSGGLLEGVSATAVEVRFDQLVDAVEASFINNIIVSDGEIFKLDHEFGGFSMAQALSLGSEENHKFI